MESECVKMVGNVSSCVPVNWALARHGTVHLFYFYMDGVLREVYTKT